MRIIAGRLRGLHLDAPPGDTTRPITDRVKETLFNILGHRLGLPGEIPDVAVLDLFAGSGGLGIEAVSRGARSCLLVERDASAFRTLRHNIEHARLSDVCRAVRENAWTMRHPRDAYGLIFVDPPYRDCENAVRVLELISRLAASLTADGLLMLRHGREAKLDESAAVGLRGIDHRTYGDMHVRLFEREIRAGAGSSAATPDPLPPPPPAT
ncbi:MAG: hypothetical protein CHACPFDD_01272 [Phycisphaerae bacterium]|nr:hypothetical protein [Phycisphaerae bacterium]